MSLSDYLRQWPRAVLLFSGGVDSGLLLAVAAPILGPALTVLTFTGPHVSPGELAAAWRLARQRQVPLVIKEFDPLNLWDFRHNTRRRCYACKKAILLQAKEVAAANGAEVIWDGTNLDDLTDDRPGLAALQEFNVRSPLAELGWDKAAVREAARRLGLPWQKAPQSCLATRFPYDTQLSLADLARVGQAEAWLQAHGFSYVRLRVQGSVVRLELPAMDWAQFFSPPIHRSFLRVLHRLGWGCLEVREAG